MNTGIGYKLVWCVSVECGQGGASLGCPALPILASSPPPPPPPATLSWSPLVRHTSLQPSAETVLCREQTSTWGWRSPECPGVSCDQCDQCWWWPVLQTVDCTADTLQHCSSSSSPPPPSCQTWVPGRSSPNRYLVQDNQHSVQIQSRKFSKKYWFNSYPLLIQDSSILIWKPLLNQKMKVFHLLNSAMFLWDGKKQTNNLEWNHLIRK